MATYGSLLIDAGGGVIDHQKQSDKQPGATVIIGLGGTGSDAVIRLKREVYKQLKPDDEKAVIPKYENIKYLIIDSDEAKINASNGRPSDIDGSTEFFSVSNRSIRATFAAKEIMKNRRELDWLDYENISIDDASAGAGGIRQVGRFLLVDKAEHLYAKIKSTFTNALIGTKGKLTVHICSGISGGTGSGTFLDVCYLVREALKEIGKPESSVCGYFFLPDVNLSVPAIATDPLKSKFVSVNGFAALKELDYCMNFGKNKDSFRMNYGFKTIDDRQKPVDLCYLISTTDEQGNVIKDGYDYAMGVVTDFIISFLAKVQLPPGVSAESDTKGITLEGHISNLNTIRSGISLQHGGIVDYNVLGASIAEMPLSEIATYLGYRLFECYSDIYDRIPTEKDRDDFLTNTQLKYEDIRKALTRGCLERIEFPRSFDAKMFQERGNGRMVEFADEYLANNKGVMARNCQTFSEGTNEFVIPSNSTSLIGRTYQGLCGRYVTQLEYGPFFAQRMLYGTQNQNLLHAVDGFIAQNQTNLDAELRQSQLREETYDGHLARMNNANIMNRNKRFEEYLNALNNLYVHHYKVEMFQMMDVVLRNYRDQLEKLNNNFFRVLTTMLDTLKNTFEENGKVLTNGERTENTYSWKILSISDIKANLDKDVRSLDLQQTLYSLMMTMMDNCTKWINADENEIAKLISDFILQTFSQATQKTITDYLKVKFNANNPNILADNIDNQIMRRQLGEKSTPLFWKNSMYQNAVGMNSTLTVPYNSAEIKTAANSYASREREFLVRESGITDKISMMRFYSGLPMYAYQGILELQDKYERDNRPGRHLYERGKVNWNKWLPSPIPASFKVGIPIERIVERNNKLIEEFKQAETLGVVKEDGYGHWELQKTEVFDVESYIEAQGGYMNNGKVDMNKLQALVEQLEKKKQDLSSNAEPVRIECVDARDGSEYQVMLDFYLASPVLNQMLREELKKQETLTKKIEELKAMKDKAGVETRQQRDFFNAIFTGVLSYGNVITYTYDEFGIEKVIVLQNNEMKFGDTGAYQAYLTYITLDESIKKDIVTTSKLRMNEEDCAEVKEAVERLDANMARRIARYNIMHDETDPLHNELEKFYGEFMKAFHAFKLMV